MLRELDVHFGLSFPTKEVLGQGKPSWYDAVPSQGQCGQSIATPPIPLGLCDARSCFSLTPTFKCFHNGVLSMNNC